MQRIERYGVIALVLLLVTVVAVTFWEDGQAAGPAEREQRAGRELAARLDEEKTGSPGRTRAARAIDPQLPAAARNENRAARPDPVPEPKPAARNRRADSRRPFLAPVAHRGDGPGAGRFEAIPPREGGGTSLQERGFDRDEGGIPYRTGWNETGAPGPALGPIGGWDGGEPSASTPGGGSNPEPALEAGPRASGLNVVNPGRAVNPTARPNATPAPGSRRTYVVEAGDTLSEISSKCLGTSRRWRDIQTLNGITDPTKIHEGMELRLPGDVAAPPVASSASIPPPPIRNARNDARRTPALPRSVSAYVVKKGDMLSVIAQRELGSAKLWPSIAALNPSIDPDHLQEGAVLRMPEAVRASNEVAQTSPTTNRRRRVR